MYLWMWTCANVFANVKAVGGNDMEWGEKRGLRWVEVAARMKPSLCFVRFLAVRDERMISHAACRNADTNTLPSPGPQKRKGKKCKQATEIGTDQCPQTSSDGQTNLLQPKRRLNYVCFLYLKVNSVLFSSSTDNAALLLTIHHPNHFISDQAGQQQYWFLSTTLKHFIFILILAL